LYICPGDAVKIDRILQLALEGVFLAFIISWYLSRYYSLMSRLPFNTMLVLIIVLSLGVLVGGGVWDWVRGRKRN
jgi:hypothetical protein